MNFNVNQMDYFAFSVRVMHLKQFQIHLVYVKVHLVYKFWRENESRLVRLNRRHGTGDASETCYSPCDALLLVSRVEFSIND